MTKRGLMAMGLKFAGIVYSLHAINSFLINLRDWPQLNAHGMTHYNINGLWAIGITSCLIKILFSLALILWGDCFARRLLRQDTSVLPEHDEGWEKCLFETTLKFLGCLYLLWGLSLLVTDGITRVFHWTIFKDGKDWFTIDLPANLRTVLIGIALIALSNILVKYAYQGPKVKAAPRNAN